MSEQEHFVYLLARRDGEKLNAPVKVGITNNVGSRFRAIQTACPFPIAMVHCLNFPDRSMARSVEAGFHKLQSASRSHGEWFDMSPSRALALLCLMVRVAIHANGYEGDDAELALDAFGAGESAHALINELATTGHGALQ